MNKNVAQVVVGLPVAGPFDYAVSPEDRAVLALGQRVVVPFAGRQMTGYVVGFAEASVHKELKTIGRILDDGPILSSQQLVLTRRVAERYGCSWGEAIEASLPFAIRNRKKLALGAAGVGAATPVSPPPILIVTPPENPFPEAVAREVRDTVARGETVLYLAPDGVRAGFLEVRLRAGLTCRVARLDPAQGKRYIESWLAARRGEADVVLGVRSAVFTQLPRLGLIVIDEEQSYGYVEDQAPFYHAREVAVMRAALEGCRVAVVSCAPTVEAWEWVRQSGEAVRLPCEPPPAGLSVMDLGNYKPQGATYLVDPCREALRQVLERNERVLVLLNRRGFSGWARCSECGAGVSCPRCDIGLVYVQEKKKAVCLRCGHSQPVDQRCPECGSGRLVMAGSGVERVAQNLARVFPAARAACYERESEGIADGVTLLVATQAVFRETGRWRPDVSCLLDADAQLGRFDFRGGQKIFSQLMALRWWTRQTVFVQTAQPGHPAFVAARQGNLEGFYRQEADTRRELGLPPFACLGSIVVRSTNIDHARDQAEAVAAALGGEAEPGLETLEPQPDVQAKVRDQYRFVVTVKGPNPGALVAAYQRARQACRCRRGTVMTIQIDP